MFWDAEGDVLDGAPLFPVEDLGHISADDASSVEVKRGESVPVLCLEAIQDLEDGVGVVGEAPIRDAHRVDGAASVSSRMRLTYHRDLYGVSFLSYLSRSWAAATMRWAGISGAGAGGW